MSKITGKLQLVIVDQPASIGALRLLGRSAWYAPGFLRKFHGRFGLSEGGPAPAPASPVESQYVKDSTGV
ncbi:hypothetical protein ACWD4T_49075 [Streptomyces umbrinus]